MQSPLVRNYIFVLYIFQANEPSTISSMSSPAFRYPVSPIYGNHQGYSFFQPTVMSQWATNQHYFDPSLVCFMYIAGFQLRGTLALGGELQKEPGLQD